MPQAGRKFVFKIHSYQSRQGGPGTPPDLTIKLGDTGNLAPGANPRDHWDKLLKRIANGCSTARLLLNYARSQAHSTRPKHLELARYYFLAPGSSKPGPIAITVPQKLQERAVREIGHAHMFEVRDILSKLKQHLDNPLEVLGTGEFLHGSARAERTAGYVKKELPGSTSRRKVHVRLDLEVINGNIGEEDIARTVLHELTHKLCNTRDHYYHNMPSDGRLTEADILKELKDRSINVNLKGNIDSFELELSRLDKLARFAVDNADSYPWYIQQMCDCDDMELDARSKLRSDWQTRPPLTLLTDRLDELNLDDEITRRDSQESVKRTR